MSLVLSILGFFSLAYMGEALYNARQRAIARRDYMARRTYAAPITGDIRAKIARAENPYAGWDRV